MSPDPEDRLAALEEENRQLREALSRLERREQGGRAARRGVLGGVRLLVPLFDRQKVVRSFGALVDTAARFTEAPERWPSREELITDGRRFVESTVRFVVRRRLFVLLFSILALLIPAFQLALVFQQNRIIENQNEMFAIQIYDVVARSLTEGDRNARVMAGALLARAEPSFLEGVIEETFDPTLSEVYREEGVDAAARRLEDAAHRGHLVRALDRAIAQRAEEEDADALHARFAGSLAPVLADAAARVPAVLRLGRRGDVDPALAEQVDNYLVHVGGLLATDARLSRQAGAMDGFWRRARPLFERLGPLSVGPENHFYLAFRTMLEDLLLDLALAPDVGAPADLAGSGLGPQEAIAQGLDAVRGNLEGVEIGGLARVVRR